MRVAFDFLNSPFSVFYCTAGGSQGSGCQLKRMAVDYLGPIRGAARELDRLMNLPDLDEA